MAFHYIFGFSIAYETYELTTPTLGIYFMMIVLSCISKALINMGVIFISELNQSLITT